MAKRPLRFEKLEDRTLLVAFSIAQTAVNPSNGHTYHLLKASNGTAGLKWTDAEAAAISLGGHLATINDAAENDWVSTTFKESYLWIGLNDELNEGQFIWPSGQAVSFANWASGEPNNSGSGEDYALIHNWASAARKWNDVGNFAGNSSFSFFGVAEIEPSIHPALAATYSFSGHIQSIDALDQQGRDAGAALQAILPFGEGDTFSGQLTFDESVSDSFPHPDAAIYDHVNSKVPYGLEWQIGGTRITHRNGQYFALSVRNMESFDDFGVFTVNPVFPPTWQSSGGFPPQLEMQLGASPTTFDSTELPTNLNLSAFSSANIFIDHTAQNGQILTLTTPLGTFTGSNIFIVGKIDNLVSERDTDGDGLLDDWEINGIDSNGDGVVDLRLKDANPLHKDLYVEIDAMMGRTPWRRALEDVVAAFAAAPVGNPDGKDGVTLHYELDDLRVPLADFPNGLDDLYLLKDQYFGTFDQRGEAKAGSKVLEAKKRAFRYCIFANSHGTTSSAGLAEPGGDDFMVTLGKWDLPGGTVKQQAGTFMHELGHTLGLDHGGDQFDPGDTEHDRDYRFNYKPNYHSVMNYMWTTPQDGYETSWLLDYSRVALPSLNENDLNETHGIGGANLINGAPAIVPIGPPARLTTARENGPIDYDDSGQAGDNAHAQRDLNHLDLFANDPASPGDILRGHEDWSKLQYDFRQSEYYSNVAGVGSTIHGGLTREIHAMLNAIAGVSIDLDINQTASPAAVPTGNELTYTNTVANNGPAKATDTTLFVELPPGVTFVSANTPQGTYELSFNLVKFSLGDLLSGASAILTIVVIPSQIDTFVQSVTVASTQTDSLLANNANAITAVSYGRWHNLAKPLDVDGDTHVVAGDALSVINYINSFGPLEIPLDSLVGAPFYDATDDNNVAADDALTIINFINTFGPDGESEHADWLIDVDPTQQHDAALSVLADLLLHDRPLLADAPIVEFTKRNDVLDGIQVRPQLNRHSLTNYTKPWGSETGFTLQTLPPSSTVLELDSQLLQLIAVSTLMLLSDPL